MRCLWQREYIGLVRAYVEGDVLTREQADHTATVEALIYDKNAQARMSKRIAMLCM